MINADQIAHKATSIKFLVTHVSLVVLNVNNVQIHLTAHHALLVIFFIIISVFKIAKFYQQLRLAIFIIPNQINVNHVRKIVSNAQHLNAQPAPIIII